MDESELREQKLRIYEAAQHSAEHHDTVLWEVTYIIWGSSTLLLGFVLEAIRQEPLLSLITAFLSIFITVMAWRFAKAYRQVRNFKYDICQKLEHDLAMEPKQHAGLGPPEYKKGVQTFWYRTATVVFIAVWSCVALRSIYLLLCKPSP